MQKSRMRLVLLLRKLSITFQADYTREENSFAYDPLPALNTDREVSP
jgi:hypothetical protein